MSLRDEIPSGRTSVTDCDGWREFCHYASRYLDVLRDGCPTLEYIVDGYSYAEKRYKDIAVDIEQIFGPWHQWDIVEVGGGYGGQARVMKDKYPCSYSILDLPEPLELQRAFLLAHGQGLAESLPRTPDLFISNYALSEGTREMQDEYIPIAASSRRGYVIWNGWTHDTYTKEEFSSFIPGSFWIEEIPHPHAHPENKCLLWSESA